MSGMLFYDPRDKPTSTSGSFQAGCYRYFYLTQTETQTPVYADGALTQPLSQPVTAASDGRFPQIYLDPNITYRVQLYTAANAVTGASGSLIDDVDPYIPTALPNTLQANSILVTSGSTTYFEANNGNIFGYGQTAGTLLSMNPDGGTFLGTLTGCTTTPVATLTWVMQGNIVCLNIPPLTGTSNANSCTITGLPNAINPAISQWICSIPLESNGSFVVGSIAIDANIIFLSPSFPGLQNTWPISGTKGIGVGGVTVTYLLS